LRKRRVAGASTNTMLRQRPPRGREPSPISYFRHLRQRILTQPVLPDPRTDRRTTGLKVERVRYRFCGNTGSRRLWS
jgi:hypothetical protein